ncbi:helix-turn-helix domain-containing protein [Gorillibacterium sp. sgz5001074]|uniref:helix-turn-helix domain-containing protein n=1 Tax=Gorillibacterium sp. sgz5001074 TaxID=3446695 RepID=UPI003F66F0FE
MLNVSPEHYILKPSFAKILCEPAWKWQRREQKLPNYDLFYVWSGEGEVFLNGATYPVGRGSCFLFRPGDDTYATHNPQKPLTLTYIHFDLERQPDMVPERYRIIRDTVEFERLLSSYVRLFLVEMTFGAEEEARLVLKQLMIRLLREDRSEEPSGGGESVQLTEAIREVANYIRLNAGKHHRLEDLAARANLSPKYFSTKFRAMIGQSVQSYIIRSRIERAEHLLRYGGMTVTEVADVLGYRDVFFFSRQFKRHTGKSPSGIR